MSNIRAGDDVVFTGRGGYAADRKKAGELLTVGHTYRVSGRMQGRFFTGLYLYRNGARVGPFNSALFEPVKNPPGVEI